MSEHEESGKVVTSVFKRAVRNIRRKPKKEFIQVGKHRGRFAKSPAVTRTREIERTFKKRSDSEPKAKRGIVYLTHLPPGFYEKQIHDYFMQFGSVTRVKVARSEKTGKSKGHAYIEFRYVEVAKIVAETMNNYLMCNRLLKAQLIKKRFPKTFWLQVNSKKCPGKMRSKAHAEALNGRFITMKKLDKCIRKQRSKLQKLNEKLKMRNIDFSFKVYLNYFVSSEPVLFHLWKSLKDEEMIKFTKKEVWPWVARRPECADIDTEISGEGKYTRLDEDLVLEIDESDNEIEFNLPSNVIRKKLMRSRSDDLVPLLKPVKKLKKGVANGKRGKQKAGVLGLKWKISQVSNGGVLKRKKNRYFDKPLDSEVTSSEEAVLVKKSAAVKKFKKAARKGAK